MDTIRSGYVDNILSDGRKMTLSEGEAKVLETLKKGKCTRKRLREETRLCDRGVRLSIERLRRRGIRIISSNSGGYWIAKSDKEYSRYRHEYIGRAYRMLKTVASMDNVSVDQLVMNFEERGGKNGKVI